MTRTARILWTATVAAIVLVAVALLVPRQQSAAGQPFPALADSIGAYETRLSRLEAVRDSLKLDLARRQVDSLPGISRRIAQLDSLLGLTRSALTRFLAARDADSRWREYRDCLYYFGGSEAAYQSLAHDTIPLPPEPKRLPWQP